MVNRVVAAEIMTETKQLFSSASIPEHEESVFWCNAIQMGWSKGLIYYLHVIESYHDFSFK